MTDKIWEEIKKEFLPRSYEVETAIKNMTDNYDLTFSEEELSLLTDDEYAKLLCLLSDQLILTKAMAKILQIGRSRVCVKQSE